MTKKADAAPAFTDATCRVCRARFQYPTPRTDWQQAAIVARFCTLFVDVCGRFECRARGLWTPTEWAGLARMASARVAAGVELSPLDLEALEKERLLPSTR